MKTNYKILILTLLVLVTACSAQSSSTAAVPEAFKKYIPSELNGGLKLVEVENRCDGCQPWRYIDYYSNDSEDPIKREKVTVQTGYKAMYAYPGTHYFSNTKIEQSVAGEYKNDEGRLACQKLISAKNWFKYAYALFF